MCRGTAGPGFTKRPRASRMRNPRLQQIASLRLLHRRMAEGTALADEASAELRTLAGDIRAVLSVTRPDASAEASMEFLADFCLSYPARPTPPGIVACRPWGMCATLLPVRPTRPPPKAGRAQGVWVPDVTIRGSSAPAPNSRHLPAESPRRIAINHSRPS